MKKPLLLALIFTILCTLCGCANAPVFEEGTLLYDCGITSMDDIDSCTVIYDDMLNPIEVTDLNDIISLAYYEDSGPCPSELLPEASVFPRPKRIDITYDDSSCFFTLMDDGSIVTFGSTHEFPWLYKASKAHTLTTEKMKKLYEKYK